MNLGAHGDRPDSRSMTIRQDLEPAGGSGADLSLQLVESILGMEQTRSDAARSNRLARGKKTSGTGRRTTLTDHSSRRGITPIGRRSWECLLVRCRIGTKQDKV